MNELAQYPMAVAALIFIIKMLLDYIKELKRDKKNGSSDIKDCPNVCSGGFSEQEKRDLYSSFSQVKDLHEWHNKEDSDGRKLWYTHVGHEVALKDLKSATEEQTNVIREFTTAINRLKIVIEHIENT